MAVRRLAERNVRNSHLCRKNNDLCCPFLNIAPTVWQAAAALRDQDRGQLTQQWIGAQIRQHDRICVVRIMNLHLSMQVTTFNSNTLMLTPQSVSLFFQLPV